MLDELKDPPAELLRRVEMQEARDRTLRARTHALEKLAHESNPEVGAGQRNLLLVGLGAAVFAMYFAFDHGLREFLLARMGQWFRLVPLFVVLGLLALGTYIGRRSLLATRLNRQVILGFITSVWVIITRSIAIATETSVQMMLIIDALVLAQGLAIAAIFTRWSLLGATAVLLASAIGCWFFPQYSVTIFALSSVLGLMSAALTWKLWRRAG
jgi:hypothetical protein